MNSPPQPTAIIHAGPPSVATIRRCLYKELAGVLSIYNHYVSNTTASLDLETKPIIYMQKLYNEVLDQGLPFLVITTTDNSDSTRNKQEAILGYAYANFYRRLPAFGGTVEILVYLDPNQTGLGIGTRLLKVLIDELKAVPPSTEREFGIRQVLAIVPLDRQRNASENFFLKGGFEDRGRLKGVGWKMGRWIDTKTFQLSLDEESKEKEKVGQKREPERHWWSSLFRRRRR